MLQYDEAGQIEWAHAGLREWAQQLAARTPSDLRSAPAAQQTAPQAQVTPAQWHGYCSACQASVWVTPEGRCAAGHDPGYISGIQAAQPTTAAATAGTPMGYPHAGAPVQHPAGDEKASTGMLAAGWVFCALGGLIGLVIALTLVNGTVPTYGGGKVHKYDEPSRKTGKLMLVVAILAMVVWFVLAAAAQA